MTALPPSAGRRPLGSPAYGKQKNGFKETWSLVGRTPLWGLFVVLSCETFGGSLILPVFQYFCTRELHLSATQVGQLFSIFNVARIFSAPCLGRCSDALGRRYLLLTCFFCSSVCFSLIAMVQTFEHMLILQAVFGMFASGNFPLSQAMVGDCSDPENRASVMSMMMACINISMTLSPVSVVIFAFYDHLVRRYVFVAASAFCFLGFILGLCLLRESLPKDKRRPICVSSGDAGGEGRNSSGCQGPSMQGVGAGLLLIWIGNFFVSVVYMSLVTTYALFIYHAFGFTDMVFGIILCGCGIAGALCQLFVFPPLDRWLGRHMVAIVAALIAGLGLVMLPNTGHGIWLHFVGMGVTMGGLALLDPIMPDLVIAYAPSQKHIGTCQGIANAFKAVACCIAPLLAGYLYDIGEYLPFYVAAGAACCVAACVILAGFVGSAATEQEQEALLGRELDSKIYSARSWRSGRETPGENNL